MIADKYRRVFLDETGELVENLANTMMSLEDSDDPVSLIREAFRHAHSIKGSAATLNVAAIVGVAHVIEDRLQVAAETKTAPTAAEVDLLLKAAESIAGMLGTVADGRDPAPDEALLARLSSLSSTGEPVQTAKPRGTQRSTGEMPAEPATGPTSVRVLVDDLDALMDLVSELVIARGQLERHADRLIDRELTDTIATATRLLADVQQIVARSRMTSLAEVFSRMQRLVRNTARDLKVPVQFEVSGGETELDRLMVAGITDPLVHLLRNSVDHGIEDANTRAAARKPERGQIALAAAYEANMVVITVTDDGGGIDRDRLLGKARANGLVSPDERPRDSELLELIFHPGLSTKDESSEVSGRGVGMDIVRSSIRRLGGSIEVASARGEGSRFEIRLPLSLAVIEALLVDLAGDTWAIPLSQVSETVMVEPEMLRSTLASDAMMLRGETVPIIHVGPLFGTEYRMEAPYPAVVFRQRGRMTALAVEQLHRKTEIVVKPVPPLLGDLAHIAGTTILGDGSVGLILDLSLLGDANTAAVVS